MDLLPCGAQAKRTVKLPLCCSLTLPTRPEPSLALQMRSYASPADVFKLPASFQTFSTTLDSEARSTSAVALLCTSPRVMPSDVWRHSSRS
eukprot:5596809-Amphidinium_carterae.1